MIDETIQTAVDNTLLTQTDVVTLLNALAALHEIAFIKDIEAVNQKLKKSVPEKFFPLFKLILQHTEDPLKLSKIISELEKYLLKLPTARMTICYEPTREQVEQLALKIRSTLAPQAILSYQVTESLDLGVQIDFNGKTYKKTLENILTL